jgi:hypothetical protein
MYKFIISQDNKELKSFEHQNSDFEPFKWLLNHQGQSVNYALKWGGFKVQQIDEDTQESIFWDPYK